MGNRASILLIDKESGYTSFRSLGAIKRKVDKKVGHCGTLDKFAHGLLIVLTGPFTKLNMLFSGMDKSYRACIRFGEETATLDPEGEVIATAELPTLEVIEDAIKNQFTGNILQAPPIYSAIHINGKRAYKLAREGVEIEMEKRPITISAFDIISFDGRDLICDITVSKGTYIRSIARDLGLACGSRGYLTDLERTSIGPFRIEEAVSADDDQAMFAMLSKREEYLKRLGLCSSTTISDSAFHTVENGRKPFAHELTYTEGDKHCKYSLLHSEDGVLRAILEIEEQTGDCSKIFCQIKQEEHDKL